MTGLPLSTTAAAELEVPKSMPMIFAISFLLYRESAVNARHIADQQTWTKRNMSNQRAPIRPAVSLQNRRL